MNENNEFRNKLMINGATSISLGNISWFGLDTKLVDEIKALLEENEKLKVELNNLKPLKEAREQVIDYLNSKGE